MLNNRTILLRDLPHKDWNGIAYLESLRSEILTVMGRSCMRECIVHIHHLTFGMAAILRDLPKEGPRIAFCHGTDLIAAEASRSHLEEAFLTCERSDFVVFPTEAILARAHAIGLPKMANQVVIPWGLPERYFSKITRVEQASRRHPGTFRILFAGRRTQNKGLWLLNESLKVLPPGFAATAFSEVFGERLEGVDRSMPVEGRMSIRKMIDREKLARRFDDFDCLVIPSTSTEAFCLLGIEAQSRGLPVVSSNLPALKEVLGDHAIYFEAGSAVGLAEAIILIASSAELRIDLEKGAREWVGRYRIHKLRDKVENLAKY